MAPLNKHLEGIKNDLCAEMNVLKKWFDSNFMQLNPDKAKCLLVTRSDNEPFEINYDNIVTLKNTEDVKLLGVWLEKKLNFHKHVSQLCKSVSKQLAVLQRIKHTVPMSTKLQLYHSHFRSHLNYCSLVWHFLKQADNIKLEKLNHRALSFVFNDYRSSYEDILNRNNLLSLKEQRYMKIIEFTYKALNGLLPSLNNIFSTKDCKYNFRDSHKLQLPRVNTTTYGINSFKYLGSKLWHLLPHEIKSSETFEIFKEALKPTILFFIFTHNYIILCYLISQRK